MAAAIPILPQLRSLIDQLRERHRKSGVDTLLVNSFGETWSPDALGKRFGAISRQAGIIYRENGEPDRLKHLHDVRGTYVTNLCRAGLTDRQIADIVAWSESNVAGYAVLMLTMPLWSWHSAAKSMLRCKTKCKTAYRGTS